MQNFTTLAFRSLQERMSQLAIKREWNIWNQVFLSDFDGHFTTVYITIYSPTGGRQRCVGGWQSRLWAYQTAVWCSATADHLRQAHSHIQVLAMAVWNRASTPFPHREVQWNIVD